MEHTHVPQMPSLPRAAVGVPHLLHFLLFQLQLLTDAKSNECLNFCSRILAKAIFTPRAKHSIEAAISSFVQAIYLCEQSTTYSVSVYYTVADTCLKTKPAHSR